MRTPAWNRPSSFVCICAFSLTAHVAALGQINSGSDGSDGVFNPTISTNINMASRPNGIYQFTSVNIPNGVFVSFTPNASNTPVVWLVQSNCVIAGGVYVYGSSPGSSAVGGAGGPGGWQGGSAGTSPSAGQGPGGGGGCATNSPAGGSFGTQGKYSGSWALPGPVYGNSFLLPLMGGSGGGGYSYGGGGGGGAILIAASGSIQLTGTISARGGDGYYNTGAFAGGGSGGAVRLVATSFSGPGLIDASGGGSGNASGGNGRIRIDAYQNSFGGILSGVVSQGFQPIILPTAGTGAQVNISAIGGASVATPPSGQLSIPDAIISSGQSTPIPIVVACANISLGTAITVNVRPATGATVSAVGYNNSGTAASSTATVLIMIPRGGGIMWATAAAGN